MDPSPKTTPGLELKVLALAPFWRAACRLSTLSLLSPSSRRRTTAWTPTTVAVFILLLSLALPLAVFGTGPLLIFGGNGHKEFLGCLNCNEYHPDSVWNSFSRFGFENDFGVWNPYGEFANPFSPRSICNEFSTDPPVIVDRSGTFYGRLTVNEFAPASICGRPRTADLCKALHTICKAKN